MSWVSFVARWNSTQSGVELLNEKGCAVIAWNRRIHIICGWVWWLSEVTQIFCHLNIFRILVLYGSSSTYIIYYHSILRVDNEQNKYITFFFSFPLADNLYTTEEMRKEVEFIWKSDNVVDGLTSSLRWNDTSAVNLSIFWYVVTNAAKSYACSHYQHYEESFSLNIKQAFF